MGLIIFCKDLIMDEYRLTKDQIASLKILHRTLRDRRFADRVKAVVLLGNGWSPPQVAEALLVDEKTIRNWFALYREAGEEGLTQLHYQGKPPMLDESQQAELAKHLDEHTYLKSDDIRRYIEKTYCIKYSPTGIKELLHRLGFRYKKPKHVPGKLDPVKQKEFIKKYEKLLKTRGKNDPVYFGG